MPAYMASLWEFCVSQLHNTGRNFVRLITVMETIGNHCAPVGTHIPIFFFTNVLSYLGLTVTIQGWLMSVPNFYQLREKPLHCNHVSKHLRHSAKPRKADTIQKPTLYYLTMIEEHQGVIEQNRLVQVLSVRVHIAQGNSKKLV